MFELDNNTYNGLMKFSREVAIALKKTIPCNRIGMSVIGLEVPHVHVHLIPINSMEDMQFIKKLDKQTPSEFREVAEAISKNL